MAPLYELIGNTGMRRGETCGLRLDDIDAEVTRLRLEVQLTLVEWEVEEEDLKTEWSRRTIALSLPMRELVNAQ
ncbi:MAG TPA: hypothetical protein VG756_28320 [Pseudonocardiaceae bacterium]|nr:hypothetical protein [Pseudonocardiaceae bacterium]